LQTDRLAPAETAVVEVTIVFRHTLIRVGFAGISSLRAFC